MSHFLDLVRSETDVGGCTEIGDERLVIKALLDWLYAEKDGDIILKIYDQRSCNDRNVLIRLQPLGKNKHTETTIHIWRD